MTDGAKLRRSRCTVCYSYNFTQSVIRRERTWKRRAERKWSVAKFEYIISRRKYSTNNTPGRLSTKTARIGRYIEKIPKIISDRARVWYVCQQ